MMEQKRMTNKEYLISMLIDDPRDHGCDYKSEIYHLINCPYFIYDKRAKCYMKHYDEITKNMCEECKCKWLEQELSNEDTLYEKSTMEYRRQFAEWLEELKERRKNEDA